MRAISAIGTHRERATRRDLIRYAAAGLSLATAVLYFAIGLGVVTVVDHATADAPPILVFGGSAGAAFVLGAALLLLVDRRPLWILGALFQVGVIVMYINVAPQRTPPFEVWGILIKILQAAILATLVFLVLAPHERESA